MNWARKVVLGVGLVVAGLTLVFVYVPGLSEAIPVGSAVESLGGDYVFVAVFGAIAVALLLIAVAWRGVNGLDQTTPPTPEEVQSVPIFGSDFDDIVSGPVGIRDRFFSDRPSTVRERVRDAAVVAEMRASNCSRSTATRRVADGSWTSDREAAAFLSDDSGPDPPTAARVRAALRGQAWFQRGARRAADAVVQRAGVGNR